MTFFSSVKHRFLPVPPDSLIDTVRFLEAAKEIVPFFDVLGPTAFAPVKSDINGNIKVHELFIWDLCAPIVLVRICSTFLK
jgi:pleckstrin family protein A (phosphoinositide binding specific) protein 8